MKKTDLPEIAGGGAVIDTSAPPGLTTEADRASTFKLGKQPNTKTSATKIAWKLWTAKNGLPTRLVSVWTESDTLGRAKKTSDIRLTSWGSATNLTAPPASKTTT